ncbi:hypothetical protein BC829DRAFT_386652 [Chytridium lagenaria]|nr:hypothetical protein BC829DRAFT_386652 [Chytridium lagenaria]
MIYTNSQVSKRGSSMVTLAACSGNLELVKFLVCESVLHSQKLNSAICKAAREGHLPVVRYFFSLLYANKLGGITERARGAIVEAAKKGHCHVVEYLLPRSERSCLLNALTSAAKEGHLDVYLFNHTNARCSKDLLHSLLQTPELYANIPKLFDRYEEEHLEKDTLELAVRTQRLDVVQQLLKYDMDIEWGNAIDVAAQLGQDGMLEVFYERFKSTLSSGTVMDVWAGMGQLDGINFLERGRGNQNAAESGHLHVVKYLV